MFRLLGTLVTFVYFAVALGDGRVLVGGGTASVRADAGSGGIVDPVALQAEIFDPATGTFSPSGSLSTARFGAGAIRLPEGRVLVIGSVPPSGEILPNTPLATSSLEVFE